MTKLPMNRRTVLKGAAASAFTLPVATRAFAQGRTIKLGMVMPLTGPLAFFSEHVEFVEKQILDATGGKIEIGGEMHPFEIILKDSQSNPNRASEVTSDLILNDGVDVIMAAATPETTVPVSDQCELNGVPCITTDTPIEPYFFGRNGDPEVGFEWTNHFFFSVAQSGGTFMNMFDHVETNKVIGVLWPNDGDGNAFAAAFPSIFDERGYTMSDPGRFDMPLASHAATVSKMAGDSAEVIFGLVPPPEWTTFYTEMATQNMQPKVIYAGKTSEFPAALEAYGDRAVGIITEVWWAPAYPYKSSITGQSAQELADAYEAASGRQCSMPLGFRHAIFEVVFDGLKRAADINDPASIQEAFNTTQMETICGPIDFRTGPFPNTCMTPTAGGQWEKGKTFPLELVITDNEFAPDVTVARKTEPMTY